MHDMLSQYLRINRKLPLYFKVFLPTLKLRCRHSMQHWLTLNKF